MRELLYSAAMHFKRGQAHAEAGARREAMAAYAAALRDLHAVKPQRERDVLLARVYLARYQLARAHPKAAEGPSAALRDLRLGYSYARTTQEPTVRVLAETLWQELLRAKGSG
ncbi:hypothetical protein [Truepera radiovictrix]|uniref:Uncharacterized protein n=1 Tax=Truepera radiovictrix (strain DSM 17093 / CIP 108686 / LMG 22925 / RQ-24) TaxID=649638 RepID=D7CUZ5_TRURR|nr:hypothetical protein [Truepera radiovictrix]ADI15822.1 conserved hypothetical protein [Truepera radiovictrix DSM 17093]WMT58550.1 hypothetical protein RCV51_06295 [Truepera radiovictrix]